MTNPPALFLKGHAGFGGTPIFRDVSLDVAAGEWTCLLGSSGVGKSTVLRLFAGLDEGIDFDGRYGADDGAPLEGRVALMAQDDLLLPWLSVLENVSLGARLRAEPADRDKALHVLEQVGLAEKSAAKPGELSGGQRQRVALARTLMEARPVVLLDEPFSALDARTRSRMQELTAEVMQGRTVLLVTHDPGEAARLGHRISVMTETGIRDVPPPTGDVPRAVEATDVLQAQANLLKQLREET